MGMTRLVVFTPSFRSNSATLIICAFATPLRFTVTRVVPLPLVLTTNPVPAVTAAFVNVTGLKKVTTS